MKDVLFKFLSTPQVSIILRKIVENNFKEQKKIIKKYFSVTSEDQVLDVGCGTGEFSLFFPAKNYIGIDIDASNIEYAKQHYDRQFLIADGKKLPFEDNHFSKCLVVGVFHHLSDPDAHAVLAEIKRVLTPDGVFLVMEDTQSTNVATTLLHHFDQGKFIRTREEWSGIFSQGWELKQDFTFKNGLCFYSAFLLSPKIV